VKGDPESFEATFRRRASAVRRRLVQRATLTGLALGLTAAVPGAAAAWLLRAEGRLLAPLVAAVVFGLAGAVLAHARRALSDVQLALYLDRRLGSEELITSALSASPDAVSAPSLRARAGLLLGSAPRSRALPQLFAWHHLVAPLSGAALVAVSWLPARPSPPAPSAAPGAEVVVLESAPELERAIEELAGLRATDPEKEERLRALEERARALRERLKQGAPRREVQSELAELTDALAAERLGAASEERRGLEAALAELEAPELKGAKRALAAGDARALDEETSRLARSADPKERARAKDALDAAARAASEEGAAELGRALEEQRRRFEAAERAAATERALAEALDGSLSPEASRDRQRAQEAGDPAAARRLASALAEAVSKLTKEQREALAKRLKEQAERGGREGEPPTDEQRAALEELAKSLESEQGQKELAERLEQLSQLPEPSESAAFDQGLARAADALDGLKQELGEAGGAAAPSGSPAGTKPGAGSSPGLGGSGDPGGPAAPGGDGAPGPTKKLPGPGSPPVAASGAPLRVPGKPGPGLPGELTRVGRTPSEPGEVANVRGSGALGEVADQEIGGVSRSDVPEEYRDQVGRYFRP
jgi:hypothetical protein